MRNLCNDGQIRIMVLILDRANQLLEIQLAGNTHSYGHFPHKACLLIKPYQHPHKTRVLYARLCGIIINAKAFFSHKFKTR